MEVQDAEIGFNTSYVSVQVRAHKYANVLFVGFNTSYVSVQDLEVAGNISDSRFQYILCVGSRNYRLHRLQ